VRFASPPWLWLLLLLLPGGAAFAWGAARARRRSLARFAGGSPYLPRFAFQASPHRRAVQLLLLFATVFFGILAAARPQWGVRLEPVSRKGADVVLLLDTSLSMAATDTAPSRFEQARHGASSLVGKLAGDRVAIVTFSGHPVVACPLTLDGEAARLVLEATDLEIEPVQGTALADGLRRAGRLLAAREGPKEVRGRVVVLFSDGEDHEGGLEAALSELARDGVRVFAIGYGTPGGGPIPIRSAGGGLEGYKKDREGRIVTTRLAEDVLRRVAIETGGRYFRATPAELEIETIAREIGELAAGEAGTLLRTRYEERFQIPLAIALLALFAESFVADRRGARLRELFRSSWPGKTSPGAGRGQEAA